MGQLLKLFKKNSNIKINSKVKNDNNMTLEVQEIIELNEFMTELLTGNHYVSKRDYLSMLSKYNDTINYFKVLIDSKTIGAYCEKNNINKNSIFEILKKYENFNELVNAFNEEFINKKLILEKEYLDNILKDIDPNIILDENQRRVVLSDEDYSLVIAGAGAGKTTTVAAKVKYLVEKNNIDPKEILVISFTNKAVMELQDKINHALKIDCPIATFHATGNAILRKNSQEKLNIVDASKLYFVLQDYFKSSILICGYPLQLRYKNSYGLRLYICTNEQEICGFMTNNCNAGKLSIMKCDKCRDGYLIVKVGNHNEYFLGCTNYKKDGTGCDNIMSKKKYYEINNFNSTDEEKLEIKNTENREGSRGEECARNSKVKPGTNDLLISEHQIEKAKLDKNVSYKNIDLNEVVYITLSCLANISTKKYYGVNILIDVLRGAKSQKIVSGKLDKVYEYGKLKNINCKILLHINRADCL